MSDSLPKSKSTLPSRTILSLLLEIAAYAAPRGNKQMRYRIIGAFTCLVLAKSSNIITPLLYGGAVDYVNGDAGFSALVLWYILGAYALSRLGQQIFSEGKEYLFSRVAQRAVRGAAMTAFRHLHLLSMRFHLDRQTGGLTRAIERGAKGMEFIMTSAAFEVVPLLVEVVLVSILLWAMFGWPYAVITFATVAIYALFTVKVTEWRMKFRRQMNKADEQAATKAVDSLINYETVKYFNAEEHEAKRFDVSMRQYEDAAVLSRTSLAAVNIGQGAVIALGLVLIMGIAGHDIQAGKLSVGDFVAVNTYLLQLYLPLNFLGWVYREIRQSLIDLERMFGLLDEHPDVQDKQGAESLRLQEAQIEFKDVHFAYKDRAILKGVSFTVPAGKKVAIVGPSGAGKSTISRLLFRFYDPQKGSIEIDGQNVQDVQQASVRAAIGVVPQDSVMFNASIGYNINYGRAEASQAEIEEAAKLASIDSFIKQLAEGYDALVGERGLKLSGGEKQRVAIARAILKKPSIFLFDEATSALDSQTEKQIQSALNEVSESRTTLIIAHRLSTIVDCDEILVMREGQIAERGTHADLIAIKGLYAAMWARQASGFDIERGQTALYEAAIQQ
ncbi:MAG: ABC transporter ATP-binding protein/permease [Alphaproteobacteria bacterium]|nr:ABC transporter ATP-binding protein/permease [Alphaproteobacteria bacterium]MBL6777529.1 ABC transporter ATP-binding protein/permease [Alphaproteobacteria bacterium]